MSEASRPLKGGGGAPRENKIQNDLDWCPRRGRDTIVLVAKEQLIEVHSMMAKERALKHTLICAKTRGPNTTGHLTVNRQD